MEKSYSKFQLVLVILITIGLLPSANTCRITTSAGKTGTHINDLPPVTNILNTKPVFAEQKLASIADVAEKSVESVVNISSTKVIKFDQKKFFFPFFEDPFFERFFGPNFFENIPKEQREKSLGSGVIVSSDGIVLTNNHVIEDTEEIIVMMADGRKFHAEIIGTDPKTDVAAIRMKGEIKNIKPISFGDSNTTRLGDIVIAIGNPFGLGHTVSMGIISAKGRANVGITDYEDFIQTDAAINPGNSGGALINMRGELIGINTAIISRTGGYQGIGFAIPSNMAKSVMNSLLKYGKVRRGWLGVVIQDIDQDLSEAMGLKSTKGAIISDVMRDSPAQKANLKRGDIIVKINGEKVESSSQVRNKIAELGAGADAEIVIIRDGKEKTIKLKLGELTGEEKDRSVNEDSNSMKNSSWGISVMPIDPLVRKKFNIPEEIKDGVVVSDVSNDSPAGKAGLRPGDVIIEVNKKAVNSPQEFKSAIEKSANTLLLLVWRNGNTIFLALKK